MEVEDAGEYSCEMVHNGDTEKAREFVTVSVFERESVELQDLKEDESDEIDFIGPVDLTNSRYVSSVETKKPKFLQTTFMTSSYAGAQIYSEIIYFLSFLISGLVQKQMQELDV